MVKSINNTRGKSDKHQKHEVMKYSASHQPQMLENWFDKVTTPKIKKYTVYGQRGVKVPKERTRRVGRDPVKVEAKRQRDIQRAKDYYTLNPHKYELKQMCMHDVNIQ